MRRARGVSLVAAALALVAMVGTPPARAQNRSDCPVASDVAAGIRLTRQAPLFDMVLRRRGDVVTEDRTMVQNGHKRRVKTTLLHGLVPLVRREGTDTISQKLRNPNTGFVTGTRVRNWTSETEVRRGSQLYGTGKVTVRRAGNAKWSGNGCTYNVKRVIVTTKIENRAPSHFEYFYAPSLGVSLGGYRLGADGRTRVSSVLPERIAKK